MDTAPAYPFDYIRVFLEKSIFTWELLVSVAQKRGTAGQEKCKRMTLGSIAYFLENPQAKNSTNLLVDLINEYALDSHFWCYRVPQILKAIYEPRNEAAHNGGEDTLEDAHKIRSILYTGGLLTEVGIALQKISERA